MQADIVSVSSLTMVALVVGLCALAAAIALGIQAVFYLLRGLPGRPAGTRAGRVAYLLAAGLAVLTAILIGLSTAASHPEMGFLALFSGAIALVGAEILILEVVRAGRASRRRDAPPAPPQERIGD